MVSVRTAPATSAIPATIRMDAPTRSVSMSSTVGKSFAGIAAVRKTQRPSAAEVRGPNRWMRRSEMKSGPVSVLNRDSPSRGAVHGKLAAITPGHGMV